MDLPLLPQDKANHYTAGTAISIAVSIASALAGASPCTAQLIGGAVGTVAGAVKEGVDWWLNRRAAADGLKPPHGVDFLDFVATAAGAWTPWISAQATGALA